MRYIPPLGGNPDDPYVDRDAANGVEGSIVAAAAIEAPQREIVAAIIGAGLTPDPANLTQLYQAMQAIAAANGVTQQDLTDAVAAHEAAADPHPAYATEAQLATYLGKNGTSYYQVNTWLQVADNYGMWAPTNNAQLLPNTAGAYGSWTVKGTRGGYSGLYFVDEQRALAINDGVQGFYNNAAASWDWKFNNGVLETGTVPTARISGDLGKAKFFLTFDQDAGNIIRDSLGISSCTDHAVGQFTVNFASAWPNAYYSVGAFSKGNEGYLELLGEEAETSPVRTTTALRVAHKTSGAADYIDARPACMLFAGD